MGKVKRTYDDSSFHAATKVIMPKDAIGFNAHDLISDTDNVVLTDGEGNFSLFEYSGVGTYHGHYLFNGAGNPFALAREMISWMFKRVPDCSVIVGSTPVENKGALFVTRRCGFKFIDTISSPVGDLKISILTRSEFNKDE